jgi:peroxiredoxin
MGLPIGSEAPDFTLVDQHGSPFALSDLRGKKSVLLAFYPFAFSGVCTGELTGFRDNLGEFETDATTIAAISCDPIYSIRVLADRDGLFFPLLSDFLPHGQVASAYGVFDEAKGSARRSSYVVDRHGLITFALHNAPGEARDLEVQAAALRAAG